MVSIKNTKELRPLLGLWLQGIFAATSMLLLVVFLRGIPGKTLFPLWNMQEIKNGSFYLIGCSVVSIFVTWKNKRLYFLIAPVVAFLMTAGASATLWVAAVTFVTVSVGFQVVGIKSTGPLASSNIARVALAFWIGKALYTLTLSTISFFPINTRFLHGAIIMLLFILCPYGSSETQRILNEFIRDTNISVTKCNSWIVSKYFFLLALLLLIFAVVHPSFDGDAATMHMRIGREMLIKGFWNYPFIENACSVMPLAPQFNFSAMFLAGGVEAVKVEAVVQFLMILVFIITGGGSKASPIGLSLSSVFCLTPMFVREISSLFIDLTLCGFVVASAVLAASAIRRKSIELTALSMLCAGGAMASKNFGLILIPILCLVLCYNCNFFKDIDLKRKVRLSFIVGAAIILALFFYTISWIKTGNPVFPFYNALFKSSYWDPFNWIDCRWPTHLNWSSWKLPWAMTFSSSQFEESANGSMGLLLLVLILSGISLITIKARTVSRIIPLLIGIVYLLGVGLQIQYLRYLLPGFLLSAVSLSFYLRFFFYRIQQQLLCVTLGALFIANLVALPAGKFFNGILQISFNSRISALHNGKPSLNFIEESLNGHQYVAEIVNATARDQPTILMLGCSYGAYFNGKTIYTNWLNRSWTTIESQLLDPIKFVNYLSSNHISYVVIDESTYFDQRKFFVNWIKQHAALVAEKWGVELYKIQ